MALTAGLALALDWILFSRLRGKSAAISVVMASFGASMAIRAALEFAFTSRPAYFSHDLQIARPIAFGVKATPNQIALLAVAVTLLTGVHLLLTRTQIGRAMRAVSENQALARAALALADRAYVLVQGRKCHEGPARALANDPIIAALYLGGVETEGER